MYHSVSYHTVQNGAKKLLEWSRNHKMEQPLHSKESFFWPATVHCIMYSERKVRLEGSPFFPGEKLHNLLQQGTVDKNIPGTIRRRS